MGEEQEAWEDLGRGASERKESGRGGLAKMRTENTSHLSYSHMLSLATCSSPRRKGLCESIISSFKISCTLDSRIPALSLGYCRVQSEGSEAQKGSGP